MRRKIELVTIEAATLRAYAREAYSGAHTQAERLADLAEALSSTLDFYSEPAELRSRATTLRGAALHAMAISAELVASAAALEQLAAVWRSAPTDD